MNKVLIYRNEGMIKTFRMTVEDLVPVVQSAVDFFNIVSKQPLKTSELQMGSFGSSFLRKRLAQSFYDNQTNEVKFSIDHYMKAVELEPEVYELDNEIEICDNSLKDASDNSRGRLGSNVPYTLQMFEISDNRVVICESRINYFAQMYWEKYAETKAQIEVFEAMKKIKQALVDYDNILSKYGRSVGIKQDLVKLQGFKSEVIGSGVYDLKIRPEFIGTIRE